MKEKKELEKEKDETKRELDSISDKIKESYET